VRIRVPLRLTAVRRSSRWLRDVHSTYLNRIWVDSLVHDPDALDLLVKKVGEDRIVLGSDYPFILGEHRPGELVLSMKSLTDAQKRKILYENALKLLGVRKEQFL